MKRDGHFTPSPTWHVGDVAEVRDGVSMLAAVVDFNQALT